MSARSGVAYTLLAVASSQQNPPTWPSSVQIFSPEDDNTTIKASVDAAYKLNGGQTDNGQFSDSRFAFLFKPGSYDVEVPVGYYTQVVGLGQSPTDVVFTSPKGVHCEEQNYDVKKGALNTFWRSAENFHTDADYNWFGNYTGMLWASAQATPLRRISAKNDLILYQYRQGETFADYASGGFLANSEIKGATVSGSQQQFLLRNTDINWEEGGVWNMVFVGTEGAPESHCGRNDDEGTKPVTTADTTPTVVEKPFISIDKEGKYSMNIPQVKTDSQGTDFSSGDQVGFEHVYVADASVDTSSSINAKLAGGFHVVLSPGIYSLTSSLKLDQENQVLLGLGLATLVAAGGEPAIQVGNVDGVRVAGVLLEAGTQSTNALLVWGDGTYSGSSSNPGLMSDVFMRVGGTPPNNHQSDKMLLLNSGNVIGDNLWLWRADHTVNDAEIYNKENPCHVGAEINGADVTMYGLAVEHTLQDLVQWNGERGATYFFQAEMPYDVSTDYGDMGYVGYRVGKDVTEHSGYGVGVYHFFRDAPVVAATGISAPEQLESSFVNPLSVRLDGIGTMTHVINGKGNYTTQTDGDNAVPAWYCGSSPGPSPPAPPAPPTPPAPPSPSPPTPPTPTPPSPPSPPPPSPPAPPSPSPATCAVGDVVSCPDSAAGCAGDQCCPDGSTCPSAHSTFSGCSKPKSEDCTGGSNFEIVV